MGDSSEEDTLEKEKHLVDDVALCRQGFQSKMSRKLDASFDVSTTEP